MSPDLNKGEPLKKPPFSTRLMTHLQSQIETVPRDGTSYEPVKLDDLIHSSSRWAWDDIASRNLLHKYAKHVRSSQAFAVNLFGGLSPEGIKAILGSFFGPIDSVQKPQFEFEDQRDRLREAVNKPQRTQVDVLLQGTRSTGRNVALLVEVKLTEDDFGKCSGADDQKNDMVHLCSTPGPFGSDTVNCFKLRNAGGAIRRTYDRYIPLSLVSDTAAFDGCWYRTSAYQPMRNVALAGVLQQEDGIEAVVAVCAPLLHREMWAHFDRARSVLPPGSLLPLPAELVLSLHHESTYQFLSDRYFLDVGGPLDARQHLEVATWQIIEAFDRHFDHDFFVAETHPGGGQYDCITMGERVNEVPRSVVDLNRTGRIHVHLSEGTVTLDDGWELAMKGHADSIALEIGRLLGLEPLVEPRHSVSRAYVRAIQLAQRAGESLQWRIDENGDLRHHEDVLNLFAHRLERHGPQYVDSGLPEVVYSSRYTGRT
jgi:hypothetical protein